MRWIPLISIGALLLSDVAWGRPWPFPRCRLEQVSERNGEIRALAAVTELGGARLLPERHYQLRSDEQNLDCESHGCELRIRRFEEQTEQALHVAVLIEAVEGIRPETAGMKRVVGDFLQRLPSNAKVKLIRFGESVRPDASFATPAAALDGLNWEETPDEVQAHLLDALRQAMHDLGSLSAKPGELPPRSLIVLLSDGMNWLMDFQEFADLGDALRRAGIVVFPIALPTKGRRLPLFNLAELAKRTAGTYRWVEPAADQSDETALLLQTVSLTQEVQQTQILTFSGPDVKKFRSKLREKASNQAELSLDCGDRYSNKATVLWLTSPHGRRGLWLFLIVFGVFGPLLFLIRKRK